MDDIRYIDLDPDEIMHWKYIKREKLANGKWRYYYDQSEVDKTNKMAKDAYYDKSKAEYVYANAASIEERKRRSASNMLNNDNAAPEIQKKYAREWLAADLDKQIAKQKLDRAENWAKFTAKTARKLNVTTLPARLISKGVVAIANLLTGGNKNKSMETMANVKARGTNKKRIANNYKNQLVERVKANSTTKRKTSTAKKTAYRNG